VLAGTSCTGKPCVGPGRFTYLARSRARVYAGPAEPGVHRAPVGHWSLFVGHLSGLVGTNWRFQRRHPGQGNRGQVSPLAGQKRLRSVAGCAMDNAQGCGHLADGQGPARSVTLRRNTFSDFYAWINAPHNDPFASKKKRGRMIE